jgi:hypothetical protein
MMHKFLPFDDNLNDEDNFQKNTQMRNVAKFNVFTNEEATANRIQAWYRGCSLRKQLKKQDDKYTFNILMKCLEKYNNDLKFNDEINPLLSKKKRRNENLPCDISENIVKFVIKKKYGVMPCWDTDKGDIVINKLGLFKQIEVKGFMSDGPSSFGPKEMWDLLYFVDARDIMNLNFKVYEVKLSNDSTIFRNIKVSKKDTYGVQADKGRRPRGCFDTIFKPQLNEHCKLIFDGHITTLYDPL